MLNKILFAAKTKTRKNSLINDKKKSFCVIKTSLKKVGPLLGVAQKTELLNFHKGSARARCVCGGTEKGFIWLRTFDVKLSATST